MRALALFLVLALAKGAMLAAGALAFTPWLVPACFAEDALVALAFAALDRALGRPRIAWALYGALAVWAAVNVPVGRLLSTPLTAPMLRAARGALLDSAAHHATAAGLAPAALVLAAAAALPFALRRLPRPGWRAALAGAALAALGPVGLARVETLGLHRSAPLAALRGLFPRAEAAGWEGTRESPFPAPAGEDLRGWRGAAAGRSVVLVALESTPARALRPWGAAEDPMPFVSGLAREGLVFENAYTPTPESIRCLSAVLGTSLAPALGAAGARTALFHSGRFDYLGMDEVVRAAGFEKRADAGEIGGERESSFGVEEPATVRAMLRWVDGLPRGARFFLTYLPIAGHHPYETSGPGRWPGRDERTRHRNALDEADRALRSLADGLRERGLLERTVWAVYGDHGEAFGEHEGNFGHTLFLYEENVRVPLVFWMPEAGRPAARARRVASLVDVAPTVLDLLGHAGATGSLLEPGARMALFATDYSQPLVGLRDGRWKLIVDLGTGRARLFDVEADPGETRDLAVREAARVAVWRARIERAGR
jgi:hypothetical protein